MKEQIIAYLQGPRHFDEGVALYEQFGINKMLKAQFRKIGNTDHIRNCLYEELRKLAELSEYEFHSLQRLAYIPVQPQPIAPIIKNKYSDEILIELAEKFGVTVDELVSDDIRDQILNHEEYEDKIQELEDELNKAKETYIQVPEAIKQTIRFREKYPFLNSADCPDELKILVADMFAANDAFRQAHEQLVSMPDDAPISDAYLVAQTAVEKYLENREMWEELDYYKENGQILGKAKIMARLVEEKELKAVSTAELAQKIANSKCNVSKSKKKLELAATDEDKAAAQVNLEKWETTKEMLVAEMETRK